MAEHEGWIPITASQTDYGSRAYRHHNPLNLRKSPFEIGTKDGFSIFKTDMDGIAGAIWDLRQKAKGNTSTGLNGDSTLRDLIYKWAPASDGNIPEAYLKDILIKTGFAPTTRLKDLLI